MDFMECLKTEQRMCKYYKLNCRECPLSSYNNGTYAGCSAFMRLNPEKYVEIIKKWVEEHPRKTRQSEFLKMFPNAELEDGVLMIAPCIIDTRVTKAGCEGLPGCIECAKEYWTEEIG